MGKYVHMSTTATEQTHQPFMRRSVPSCLSVCSPTEGTYAQVMRSPISHLSMHIKSSGEENLLSNTVFLFP